MFARDFSSSSTLFAMTRMIRMQDADCDRRRVALGRRAIEPGSRASDGALPSPLRRGVGGGGLRAMTLMTSVGTFEEDEARCASCAAGLVDPHPQPLPARGEGSGPSARRDRELQRDGCHDSHGAHCESSRWRSVCHARRTSSRACGRYSDVRENQIRASARRRHAELEERSVVPRKGLEPSRPLSHWHLKPARLPIPPPGHVGAVCTDRTVACQTAEGPR